MSLEELDVRGKAPKTKGGGETPPPPPPFGAYGRTTVSRMIFSLLPSPESGSGGYEEPVREGIKMKNKSREIINYKESPSPPPRPPPFPPPPAGWLRARTAPETISVVDLEGRLETFLLRLSRGEGLGGYRGRTPVGRARRRRGNGGGSGFPPRRRGPTAGGAAARAFFSRGFLFAGRKAGVLGGLFVVVVVSGFCFVPFQETGGERAPDGDCLCYSMWHCT